jgi:hypothetical protein
VTGEVERDHRARGLGLGEPPGQRGEVAPRTEEAVEQDPGRRLAAAVAGVGQEPGAGAQRRFWLKNASVRCQASVAAAWS